VKQKEKLAKTTAEKRLSPTDKLQLLQNLILHLPLLLVFSEAPNGLRYLRVGGRGQCLGAGKTRSQKNACKSRRLPHVRCTLCWLALCFEGQ
jgi:hypothetical protein